MTRELALVLIVLVPSPNRAAATVTEFEDFGEWQAAAGEYTTIGFNEVPPFSIVTTQCTDVGVTFVDGLYQTITTTSGFPQDGFGLDGNGPITLLFSYDLNAIACHFPGFVQFDLFNDGMLVAKSDHLGMSGVDNFAGVVSSQAFDAVVISDPFDGDPFLDNLYFGPPIPAPSALSVLGVAPMFGRRRRS